MDIEQLVNFLQSQDTDIKMLEQENMQLRYDNATYRDRIKELERKAS